MNKYVAQCMLYILRCAKCLCGMHVYAGKIVRLPQHLVHMGAYMHVTHSFYVQQSVPCMSP